MNRREFLKWVGASISAAALPSSALVSSASPHTAIAPRRYSIVDIPDVPKIGDELRYLWKGSFPASMQQQCAVFQRGIKHCLGERVFTCVSVNENGIGLFRQVRVIGAEGYRQEETTLIGAGRLRDTRLEGTDAIAVHNITMYRAV